MSEKSETGYKIILTDNLNLDYPLSDILVAESIRSESEAEFLAEKLNEKYNTEYSSMYYKAVPGDFKLYVWDGEY